MRPVPDSIFDNLVAEVDGIFALSRVLWFSRPQYQRHAKMFLEPDRLMPRSMSAI